MIRFYFISEIHFFDLLHAKKSIKMNKLKMIKLKMSEQKKDTW